MSVVSRIVINRVNRKARTRRTRIAREVVFRDVNDYEYYLAITALGGR